LQLIALILAGLIVIWGIIGTAGLSQFSSALTGVLFTSRGWFIMLSVSLLLILCMRLYFKKESDGN
jgi:glycine betaine transporter